MTEAGLLLALLILLAAGFGILCWVKAGRVLALSEAFGLSVLLGTGFVSIGLWIGGLVLRGPVLFAALGLLSCALLWSGWRRLGKTGARSVFSFPEKLHGWEWLVVALLITQGVWFFIGNFKAALVWDSHMIWEAKARWAFQSGGSLPVSYFSDASRGDSQPFYPLLFPYLETWLYLGMGEANQSLVRVVGLLFYFAAQCLLISGIGRLTGSRFSGLLTAFLFVSVPYLFATRWGASNGNTDFAVGTIYLAAVSHALCWVQSRHLSDLRILGLCAALLPWTKREGKFLWAAAVVIPVLILLREKKWRQLAPVLAPGVLIIAAWAIFLHSVNVCPDPTYASVTAQTLLAHMDRIGPISSFAAAELADTTHWSIWWPVTAGALCLLWIKGRKLAALTLTCALGVPLTLYGMVYLFSKLPSYILHMEISFERLVLHILPTALLTFGLLYPTPPIAIAKDSE